MLKFDSYSHIIDYMYDNVFRARYISYRTFPFFTVKKFETFETNAKFVKKGDHITVYM